MKRLLGLRPVIAAAVLIAAVLGFFAVLPETEAFAGICTYYSNASRTTVVGQRGSDCCGVPVNWGVVTRFRTCEGPVYCVWCPPPTE
jgi:hypothetical protein